MKLEQSFEVAAPLERVWQALIDVERVAPCLPGASVTGRNDDGSYRGEFKVKVGPTSAAYAGKLAMEDIDAEAHRATMSAAGSDTRGQGGASATIVSTVTAAGEDGSTVEVSTDYHITGRLARFGRGGMIEAISQRLLGEFASNLQAMLAGELTPGEAVPSTDGGVASGPEPPSEGSAVVQATPPPGAPAVGDARTAAPRSAPESDPVSATSLVGSVVRERIRSRPAAVAAFVVGAFAALGVVRRRRR